MYQGESVKTERLIYTPSSFARQSLFHLQEIGELQALKPHTSKREDLTSLLFFYVIAGNGTLIYEDTSYSLSAGDCVVNGKLYLSHLGKKGNEYLSHPTKPL